VTIGLALAAGSYPAATVTGGIMRGFQQKKILDGDNMLVPSIDKIAYTSGSSGGHFPGIMYAYAKDTTSDLLLDVDGISKPYDLTKQELEKIPETSMFSRFTVSILPYIVIALIWCHFFGGALWPTIVYFSMLEPLGIGFNDPVSGPRREDAKPTPIASTSMLGPLEMWPEYLFEEMFNRFFENGAASYETNLMKDSYGFFYATNTSYVWNVAKMSDFQIPVLSFITPDEYIIPMHKHQMKFDPIGNTTAAADPINYEPVLVKPDDIQPQSDGRFTVAKMLGAATNLIPLLGAGGSIPPDILTVLNTPITINMPTADGNYREMTLADSGYNDSTGIPALVHKGVRKIICTVYNSGEDENFLKKPYDLVDFFMAQFFGFADSRVLMNHMFDNTSNGENQVLKLLNIMKSLFEAGEPMITTLKDLDVIENPFYGIEGGGKVDLTVIGLFGVPTKFADQLPEDVAAPPEGMSKINEFGYFNNQDFSTVPNLVSFDTGGIKVDLPILNIENVTIPLPDNGVETKQAKMTYVLSSWMICYAWYGLWVDGEMKFEGFKEIFE
jgi:hypothetical protein